ncbi:MAG: hypothetical protein JNL73_10575 [Anaerolineales bacterium]|nr:hypothetical protein [Anaerolineales bacterium]
MPKYLCLLRSQPGQPQPGQMPSPSQMEAMYAQFNAWKDTFQHNIVDLGGKLSDTGKVLTTEGVTDGPFVEAKEVIGGYMILAASTMEEAMEAARHCPGVISPGTSLEIREFNTP